MQKCTLDIDKCKPENGGTIFWKEKCRKSTIASATKMQTFVRKKPIKDQNIQN